MVTPIQRIGLGFVLAATTFGAAAVAAASGATLGRCSPDVTVVRQEAGVRLFHYRSDPHDFWACVPGARRARELTEGFDPTGECVAGTCIAEVYATAIAGSWAAVALEEEGRTGADIKILAVNAKTGKRVDTNATDQDDLTAPLGDTAVTDLAIAPKGGVAWILRNDLPGSSGGYEVRRADSLGRAVLASGAVGPTSLAIAGNRIYWLAGNQAQSAFVSGPDTMPNPAATGHESR